MTDRPEPNATPGFTVRRDPRHDRAMDLSALVRQWAGFEQTHRTAAAITAVAARMEAEAAEAQPEENRHWKAVLYRSAAWLCVKGHPADPSLLDLAEHCLRKARELDSPETRELADIETALDEARDPISQPEPLRPLHLCCLCRISLNWSRHPPRPLSARGLELPVPAGYLCSQCEWTLITTGEEPPTGDPADIAAQIEAVLAHNGRPGLAPDPELLRQDESAALLATARRHWQGSRHPGAAILAAVEQGTLIPFGIWP